jgi:hypothetical protein
VPFCQTKEDPPTSVPEWGGPPGVVHRLPEWQSDRTRKATGEANRPVRCKVIDAIPTAARS